ncbi:unnamed protein product [Hymenolepis diminuta]|uniref:DUF2281 domain-containing protein n=1 Tax=Hymenolepis diminuta TaxID=6216 RepID=A0A0R3SQL9_HYMDI|nr:unnamed protein product [Hymenolepis diminuta]
MKSEYVSEELRPPFAEALAADLGHWLRREECFPCRWQWQWNTFTAPSAETLPETPLFPPVEAHLTPYCHDEIQNTSC